MSVTPYAKGDHGTEQLYLDVLSALARFNARFMGQLPPLYRSGVRYVQEVGHGHEHAQQWFRDAATIMRRRAGHCPGLTAWRLAELHAQGAKAWAVLKPTTFGYHALILRRLPNGRKVTEDPSLILGMGR